MRLNPFFVLRSRARGRALAPHLFTCLLMTACADETAADEMAGDETEADSLDPATGASFETLALATRNPYCRRGRVWVRCGHDPVKDAAVPPPRPTFTVTGGAGKGGSIEASSPTGTCTNAGVGFSCTVPEGGSVAVRAQSASSWRVLSWSCPAGVAAGDTASLTNVHADSDCSVSFIPIVFGVSYQAVDESGAVLPGVITAYDVLRGPCTDDLCRAQQGETVVLTAGPSSGLTFVGWSGCSDSKTAELSFVVTADQTCVAHYQSATVPVQ